MKCTGDKHKCNKWSMKLLQTTKTRGNSGQLFLLSCAHVQTCTYIHTGLPFHKICLPRFLTGFLLSSNIFLAFQQEHTADHHPCQPNIAKKKGVGESWPYYLVVVVVVEQRGTRMTLSSLSLATPVAPHIRCRCSCQARNPRFW
jgi:hypothetical protein